MQLQQVNQYLKLIEAMGMASKKALTSGKKPKEVVALFHSLDQVMTRFVNLFLRSLILIEVQMSWLVIFESMVSYSQRNYQQNNGTVKKNHKEEHQRRTELTEDILQELFDSF